MSDPLTILTEQVFPALDLVEAGELTDQEAFSTLRSVVQAMLEAATLKRELVTEPESQAVVEKVHQDLLTLDLILALHGDPGLGCVFVPEPFWADFERVLESWSLNDPDDQRADGSIL